MCPNPTKPIKESYSAVLSRITSRNMSLEDKFDIIEKALKNGAVTSMQAVDLMGVAITSLKNGVKRYPNILKLLKAILRYVAKIPVKKTINGHEYVELGDGLKWATCNVGASKPEEGGSNFKWGEVNPGKDASWESYTLTDESRKLLKYNNNDKLGKVDNKIVLESSDDAASANWGSTWRTPTKEELEVLTDKSKFNWIWDATLKGFYVRSKIKGYEGNQIFLPTTGNASDGNGNTWPAGSLWSSTLKEDNSYQVYCIQFKESEIEVSYTMRPYLLEVRPVSY